MRNYSAAILCVLLCLIVSGKAARAQQSDPVDVTSQTAGSRELLTQAMAAYRLGDFQGAFKHSRAAYLDYFEQVEPPLRVINQDLTLDMEFRFADLRSKMQTHRPPEEVEKSIARVRDGLIEIDSMFGGTGVAPLIAFSSSFVIALREGLEAILVIGALLGALRAGQAHGLGRYVLLGAGLAVTLSLIAWALLHTAIRDAPIAQQVISAAASLVAVGTLLWVNVWLINRLDQKRWVEMMRARAWAAMASGSAVGLTLIGFSAVLRQGIETALFYEVLIGYSRGVMGYVIAGAFAALIGMSSAAWLLARTNRTLSPIAFLRLVIPLLMLLSVAFIGGAVYQLQESGYLTTTSIIRNFPRLPYFVASLSGIHPSAEGIGTQFVLLVIYGLLAGSWWLRKRSRLERATLTHS